MRSATSILCSFQERSIAHVKKFGGNFRSVEIPDEVKFHGRVLDKYRKSYERECISGFMMLCNLRNFKTSRVTIDSEMHSRSYDFLFIIYLTKLLSRRLFFELFVLEFFRFWVYVSFSHDNLLLGSLHSLYSGFQKGPN